MLKGEQSKEGKTSYILIRGINAKNTARLVQLYLPLNGLPGKLKIFLG